MLLSELIYKNVQWRGVSRGVCVGVGISLKNCALKYFLCSGDTLTSSSATRADFYLNANSLQSIQNASLIFSSTRPLIPKAHARLSLKKPVYTQDGEYLGEVKDVEFSNLIITRLFTERDTFSMRSVLAISDAVILRKEQPFPLGLRIPAPIHSHFSKTNGPVVTKSVLRRAIQKDKLIALTLSLPPFEHLPSDKR